MLKLQSSHFVIVQCFRNNESGKVRLNIFHFHPEMTVVINSVTELLFYWLTKLLFKIMKYLFAIVTTIRLFEFYESNLISIWINETGSIFYCEIVHIFYTNLLQSSSLLVVPNIQGHKNYIILFYTFHYLLEKISSICDGPFKTRGKSQVTHNIMYVVDSGMIVGSMNFCPCFVK